MTTLGYCRISAVSSRNRPATASSRRFIRETTKSARSRVTIGKSMPWLAHFRYGGEPGLLDHALIALVQISSLLDAHQWQERHSRARIDDQREIIDRFSKLEANQSQLAAALGIFHVTHTAYRPFLTFTCRHAAPKCSCDPGFSASTARKGAR